MTEDAQLKLRVPQELKEYLENEAKANQRTINGEVVYQLEQLRKSKASTSGRSIYFNDINCIEDFKGESLHKQTERVEQMISDLFYRNPQYQLINIETLNNDRKIRYWYSIPRGESFRD